MFNIRVYGILIADDKILLSEESFRGVHMIKFVGGGLELGEGTIDCLKREFLEEMDIEINVVSHFYTTDFYQKDAFFENSQLISIYYIVEPAFPLSVEYLQEINRTNECGITFKFESLQYFDANKLTWPVDKYVAGLLLK